MGTYAAGGYFIPDFSSNLTRLETADETRLLAHSNGETYTLYVPSPDSSPGNFERLEEDTWPVETHASILLGQWMRFIDSGESPELLGHPLTIDGLVEAMNHLRISTHSALGEYLRIKGFIYFKHSEVKEALGDDTFASLMSDL